MKDRDKQGRRVLQNLLNPQPESEPLTDDEDETVDPEMTKAIEGYWAYLRREEKEIEAIKANRPLGSVVPREPKSLLYSKVPDPVWKRKLRP